MLSILLLARAAPVVPHALRTTDTTSSSTDKYEPHCKCNNFAQMCSDGCFTEWLGDGYCDEACYTEACNFDRGDCSQGYTNEAFDAMYSQGYTNDDFVVMYWPDKEEHDEYLQVDTSDYAGIWWDPKNSPVYHDDDDLDGYLVVDLGSDPDIISDWRDKENTLVYHDDGVNFVLGDDSTIYSTE